MPNVTVSIPHQLTRAEAKQRIEEGIAQGRSQFGSSVTRVDQHWEGDTLQFAAGVMGFSINGRLFVEDHIVRVEVALPWPAALFSSEVKQGIEREGRKLLGQK